MGSEVQPARSTITGSRIRDTILFVVFLCVLIVGSPRGRVYYRVEPTRVAAVAVASDGHRSALETPESLAGVRADVATTRALVRRFAASSDARALVPPGGSVDWYVRFSVNNLRFDRTLLVATTKADHGP